MTAYLKWKGMTEATLSVFRGLGALSGLSSTFVFPQMHKWSGGCPARCFVMRYLIDLVLSHEGNSQPHTLLVSRYWQRAPLDRLPDAAGLLKTGMRGIWLQFLCLAGAVVPAVLAYWHWPIPNVVVTYAVVSGVVLSRFGLWLFDMAVNQLLQEWVPDDELGASKSKILMLLADSMRVQP